MPTPLFKLVISLFAGVSLLLCAACGGDDDDDDSMATVPCDEETRAELFSADMEKTGAAGLAIFTLNSIEPNPPDIGDNDWQLTVHSSDDTSPLSGCNLTVRPWMPDHEHGSTQPSGAEGDPGVYLVSGVRFIMPGYWESTVSITCGGGDDDDSTAGNTESLTDSAVFGLCVEG